MRKNCDNMTSSETKPDEKEIIFMKSKTKLNIALVAVLLVLAAIIFLVVTISKNSDKPEPVATNSTTLTNPATDSAIPFPTVTQTEPIASDALNSTVGSDDQTNPSGDYADVDYTPFDYFDTTDFFRNNGSRTAKIENDEAEFNFTVGVSSENEKMLYLNPSTDYTRNNVSIGYFMRCEKGIIWTQEGDVRDMYDVIEKNESNFLIERTYDQLYSAKYENPKDFGAVYLCENKGNPHDEIHVLIVDINNRRLLGIAMIDIDLIDDRYQITGVRNIIEEDPDVTELLTALMRQEILNSSFLVIPEQYVLDSSIFVEKLDGYTYYKTFKKPGSAFMTGEGEIEYPIYAVTLNNDGFGFITYYFKPVQYVGEKPVSFEVLGYDPINVKTQEDLWNR